MHTPMRGHRLFITVVVGVIGFGLAAGAHAQNVGPATDYVNWTVTTTPTTETTDASVRLTFDATIADGWKMYALDSPPPTRPVRVQFDELPSAVTQGGELQQTEPKEGYDPNFDKDVRYFESEARLWVDLKIASEAATASHPVKGQIEFMICNERMCLPPTRVPFELAVDLNQAVSMQAGADRESDAAPSTPAEDALGAREGEAATITPADGVTRSSVGGLWGFLLLAVGAGLAALLTPCVFPMIPLTVSYFTKHGEDRGEAMRMALVYGLAIVITFTGLGVVTALLVGAAGAQTIAANPWINLFIGVVFVIFALALLGLFELRLPSGLLNFFNRQSNEQRGYFGVLFMGFTLTLVSFSCTAPFVGGLLAATASGSWGYPVLGMLAFSATFSLPFVLFALFPNALSSLPKSGGWMGSIKVILGFIELAAAIKFLSNADLIWGWNVISRPLAIAVSVVIFFLAGLYLLGKLRLKHEPAVEHVGVGRLLAAIAFFGIALYMLPGLLGAPLNALDAYLPPRQASDVSLLAALPRGTEGEAAHNDYDWYVDDLEGSFAEARQQGKPVFVDFTGYTCTNCRDMEANVFPNPKVAERFERDFVLLRLYTDGRERGPEFQRYQLQLTGTVALPTYAVVDPQDEKLISKVSGIMQTDEFVAFLDRGHSLFDERSLAMNE